MLGSPLCLRDAGQLRRRGCLNFHETRLMAPRATTPEIETFGSPSDIDIESQTTHGQLCDACGAPFESWDKFCPACGKPTETAATATQPETARKHFRCEKCGAEVATDPEQRSYVCPFCDSTYVVELPP